MLPNFISLVSLMKMDSKISFGRNSQRQHTLPHSSPCCLNAKARFQSQSLEFVGGIPVANSRGPAQRLRLHVPPELPFPAKSTQPIPLMSQAPGLPSTSPSPTRRTIPARGQSLPLVPSRIARSFAIIGRRHGNHRRSGKRQTLHPHCGWL